MNSVISFPERGHYGKSSYRGNCSGYVQKALFEQFHSKEVTDPMAGSFTTRDVCNEMGIISHCYDLSTGFNALIDDLPEEACGSDTWFFHPPYGPIRIPYAGAEWDDKAFIKEFGYDPKPYDLGRMYSWEEFMKAINYCVMKFYSAMDTGARMCILMGDIKRNGQLFSMIRDIAIPSNSLENIVIKMQHNCMSDQKTYSNKNFIPIIHEYIAIIHKLSPYMLDYYHTKLEKLDIRDSKCATWRDLVKAVLSKLGGNANLEAIYAEIDGHEKCKENHHWKEKVRQTLQLGQMFTSTERGHWTLAA